jgi:hypothetical protein
LAILSEPAGEWPKLGRNQRAAGYEWKGYTLDKARVPTFFYTWNGITVTDRFEGVGNAVAPEECSCASLEFRGATPSNAYLRVANGENIRPEKDAFIVDGGKFGMEGRDFENRFVVAAAGARLRGKDVIVPVRSSIRVTYAWPNTHAHHALQEAPKTAPCSPPFPIANDKTRRLCSILLGSLALHAADPVESDFYTTTTFSTPSDTAMEVGSIELLPNNALALGTRRGEIWVVENAQGIDPPR